MTFSLSSLIGLATLTLLLNMAAAQPLQANENAIDRPTQSNIALRSLPDAEKIIDNEIAQLANSLAFIERMKQIEFRITVADENNAEAEDTNSSSPPFSLLTTPQLYQALEQQDDLKLTFRQHIANGESRLELNNAALEKILDRAAPSKYGNTTAYRITTLYFRDGSEQTLPVPSNHLNEDDNERLSLFRREITLPTHKPLEKIAVDIHFESTPAYQKIVLNMQQPEFRVSDEEFYRLVAIGPQEATLYLAMPKHKTFHLEGISPGGNIIDTRGSSSQTLPGEQEQAILQQYYDALVETKRRFNTFNNTQQLQAHLDQINAMAKPLAATQQIKHIQKNVYFNATPAEVVLYLFEEAEQHQLSRQYLSSIEPRALYIGHSDQDNKAGLIDTAGNWVVKPQFKRLQYTDVDAIYRIDTRSEADANDWNQPAWQYGLLPPETAQFEMLPFYRLIQSLDNQRVLVQRETNGPYGVYHIPSRQFIIPMRFVNPTIMDNVFIASLGEKTYGYTPQYGVYSCVDGKEIIPPKYKNIEGQDGFIYINDRYREVFDPTGKRLTPQGYNAIGHFYQQQPLLTQHAENKTYRFIDQQGKSLNFSLRYDRIEPFSNGMAIVSKNSKFGAINVAGKLTVPLIYDRLYPFQANLAAAEKRDAPYHARYSLIDKNNMIVKPLGQHLSSASYARNRNDATYTMYDDPQYGYNTTYDADGKQRKTYLRNQP